MVLSKSVWRHAWAVAATLAALPLCTSDCQAARLSVEYVPWKDACARRAVGVRDRHATHFAPKPVDQMVASMGILKQACYCTVVEREVTASRT